MGTWTWDDQRTRQKGKQESRTPFDILRSYETKEEKEANLFRLYYFAFKGSRQLNWSRGLKKLSTKGMEKSDQEIVDDTDNVAELLLN